MFFFVYFRRNTPIDKRLAPNLRRLKMNWAKEINLKSIEMLFDDDVLFSLTQFTLLAKIEDVNVLHNVLSKLSSQCSYQFDVAWKILNDEVLLSDSRNVALNIFEQLKVPMSIDMEFFSKQDHYSTRAMTLPRMDSFFSVFHFKNAMRM